MGRRGVTGNETSIQQKQNDVELSSYTYSSPHVYLKTHN